MPLTLSTNFNFKLLYFHAPFPSIRSETKPLGTCRPGRRRRLRTQFSPFLIGYHISHVNQIDKANSCSARTVLARVGTDGGGAVGATSEQSLPSDIAVLKGSSSSFGEGCLPLFICMLGLEYDPPDREQAVVALWKYSLGGKEYVDAIMQFGGCINLIVNLLKSESTSASEAAAGLLRIISSTNQYRDSVAEGGVIEEITGLLSRPSLTFEVKEQSISVLWNLSVDDNHRIKIANSGTLPLLVKYMDDEDMKVKEAVGGVLANLALSPSNHNNMVEAGIIPKLASLLKPDVEVSKVIRKEARSALLELAKDEYYKDLIIDEGLVLVPLVGAAAYRSFKPATHSWPSLPDGTKIRQNAKGPSRYGASEMLLGLNIEERNTEMEEAKMNAIIGRARQQFLARIGAIETSDETRSQSGSSKNQGSTILQWRDAVARLIIILGLEDESAITRAAQSIAIASVNEHMRISFKEAGAVKPLVQLLNHHNYALQFSAACALERLSVSNVVCQSIEVEGVIYPLCKALMHSRISGKMMEKTLDILARILDPAKEMKAKGLEMRCFSDAMDGDLNRTSESNSTARKELLNCAIITRLVEILKLPSSNMQKKAAFILEYLTTIGPCLDKLMSADIKSGLAAVLHPNVVNGSDMDGKQPEIQALEMEEAGLAISAASRLLSKLLDFEQFHATIDPTHFAKLLCRILRSSIPFPTKEWVAACLVKFTSLFGTQLEFERPIDMEITLHETIPRLIEQIESSSPKAREAAAVELNGIILEAVVDSTRAVAVGGGISPLVKLIEEGSERSVEVGLAILYNLSMDSENHYAILAAGVVPALRRIILSRHPQWTRALRLLKALPT